MPLSQPKTMGVLLGSPSPLAPHAASRQVNLLNISSQRSQRLTGRWAGPDLAPPLSSLAMSTLTLGPVLCSLLQFLPHQIPCPVKSFQGSSPPQN